MSNGSCPAARAAFAPFREAVRKILRRAARYAHPLVAPHIARPLAAVDQHRLMTRRMRGIGKSKEISLRPTARRVTAPHETDSHGSLEMYFKFIVELNALSSLQRSVPVGKPGVHPDPRRIARHHLQTDIRILDRPQASLPDSGTTSQAHEPGNLQFFHLSVYSDPLRVQTPLLQDPGRNGQAERQPLAEYEPRR